MKRFYIDSVIVIGLSILLILLTNWTRWNLPGKATMAAYNPMIWAFVCMVVFVFVENALIFFVQKVSDFFHHGDGVGFFLRVLSELDEFSKKFLVVSHVEVAGHDEVSASPVILFEKRVACFDAVFSVGSVA